MEIYCNAMTEETFEEMFFINIDWPNALLLRIEAEFNSVGIESDRRNRVPDGLEVAESNIKKILCLFMIMLD